MKFKNTACIALANFILISSVAHADIILHQSSGEQDYCSTIPGNWNGTGTIKSNSLTCNYSGSGTIRATANPTQFLMDVSMQRTSGSKLCPATESMQNIATNCANNVITISDMGVDLTGQLTDSGKNATVDGTMEVPGIGTVSADIHLSKQS
jgi:hypothetical protein